MDDEQLTFDAAASTAARERSIHQVDEAAEPDWKEMAYDAVCATAEQQPDGFIVDEVWKLIPEDVEPPHELRAMGAVMRRAQRDGVIVPTDEFRLSARVTAHRNPRRIWKAAVAGAAVRSANPRSGPQAAVAVAVERPDWWGTE